MPALKPTEFFATIRWLGHVPDRTMALASQPVPQLMARFAGPEGEAHGGLTRLSCSRVTAQHRRGTEIRNCRQFSIVSAEELALIAADLGLERLEPAWLGATLMLDGLPGFTHLPPSSRLQAESGATLVVDMENRPCNLPVPVIEAATGTGARSFRAAATGRRGVTAWVEREGVLELGQRLRLHIPDQPVWPYLDVALGH